MMTEADRELIAKAIRLARPISKDMSNPGVRAAHEALDNFVCELADLLLRQRNGFLAKQAFLAACEGVK